MPRYRRIPLTREKSLQAALTSALVGLGAAAATYVVARLMLQRDPLSPGTLGDGSTSGGALESGTAGALGPGAPPPAEGDSGADAGAT